MKKRTITVLGVLLLTTLLTHGIFIDLLHAASAVGKPQVTPASIPAGQAVELTVTSQITSGPTDPNVIPTGVNLLRLDSTNKVIATLGTMRDDGTNGDAAAGDGVFTLRLNINEAATGEMRLQVSAAFYKLLRRVLSEVTAVPIVRVNQAPEADAGSDQVVLVGDTVDLDGSGSSDPNGDPLTFNWSLISAPDGSTATLSNPGIANPIFTADLPGPYLVQLVMSDGLLDSAPDVAIITAGLAQLPGPGSDPANAHIPDIRFPDPPEEDLVFPDGNPISIRDLMVILNDTATVDEVNALLRSLQAGVVGGLPAARLLLLRLMGPSDLQHLVSVMDTLLSNPLVIAASGNTGYSPLRLPPHNVNFTNNRWTWETPFNRDSGNWGLKTIRMPQAWNLVDKAARKNVTIDAAVLESDAVGLHSDLLWVEGSGFMPGDHATMVAGIIGGKWHNNIGIEGVYPRDIRIVSGFLPESIEGLNLLFASDFVEDIIYILKEEPNVRVINLSMGASYVFHPTTMQMAPGVTARDLRDREGNFLLSAIQSLRSEFVRRDFLVVCAAGNERLLRTDQPGQFVEAEARDYSPCNNVAVRGADPVLKASLPLGGAGADHFLAIESVDPTGIRGYSAFGGTLSAPGVCVRSTELNDGKNADRATCGSGSDNGDDPDYATDTGTSFAAPHVTGLAAYIWSLDPALTAQEVREAMTYYQNTVPVLAPLGAGPGSPRIDGFAAVMHIDRIRGDNTLQIALVDVDDGTLDGNQRTIRADDGTPLPGEAGVHKEIKTFDSRRGDEKISMADFRVFRDAVVQALVSVDADLDGPSTHFKKDLNFDGCVGMEPAGPAHPPGTVSIPPSFMGISSCLSAPVLNENAFPRYDFNGDGEVSGASVPNERSGSLSFKGFSDTADVDVLIDLWPSDTDTTEGWSSADLRDLLPPPVGTGGSGDIEFRTSSSLWGSNGYDRIEIRIDGLSMVRTLTPANNRLVWTVPRSLGSITARAKGIKGSNETDLCFNRDMPLFDRPIKHGEDTVVTVIACEASSGPFSFYLTGLVGSSDSVDSFSLNPPPAKTCPPLEIGDRCAWDYTVPSVEAPSRYCAATIHGEVERLERMQWKITLRNTAGCSAPALPTRSGIWVCGQNWWDCGSWAGTTLSLHVDFPVHLTQPTRLDMTCSGAGGYSDIRPPQPWPNWWWINSDPVFHIGQSTTGFWTTNDLGWLLRNEPSGENCKNSGSWPWSIDDSAPPMNLALQYYGFGAYVQVSTSGGKYIGWSPDSNRDWGSPSDPAFNSSLSFTVTLTPQ